MLNDIQFITDTISIVSKVKEDSRAEENSLSRIIREQAITYDEEIPDEEIGYGFSKKREEKKGGVGQKQKRGKEQKKICSQKVIAMKEQYFGDSSKQSPLKISPVRELNIKKVKEGSHVEQIRATQRKVRVLCFDEENEKGLHTSKKEKRGQKLIFDQQKTKKIQFQDMNRYQEQELRQNKAASTKIRQNQGRIEQLNNGGLELCSKDSSQLQFEEKQISILAHQTRSNYNVIQSQLREMMAMNRWLYIDLEKVEIKKMISKVEGDIRKMKIGFRGLTQSCESHSKTRSKIRMHDCLQNRGMLKKKGENQVSKVESCRSQEKIAGGSGLPLGEYGLDEFQPQLSRSCVAESNLQQKLQSLQEEIDRRRHKSNKLALQFSELTSKYSQLRTQAGYGVKTEMNPTPSTINRVKIMRQKLSFLKNEIKETKLFYSNKIKRLKNENSILKNEARYTEKETEDIKKCVANIGKVIQKNKEKMEKIKESEAKHQIYIFDEETKLKGKGEYYTPSKITTSSRNPSNLLSGEVKSMKSIHSIKSMQSIQSFNSKPSLGSLNSYKSTKTESEGVKNEQYQVSAKPKLKLVFPQAFQVAENAKQYSILTKRKKQTEMRLGSLDREKKQSSLDVAFKQLQQKYKAHMRGGDDEYYSNRVH